jgi:flagellin-like hook-associated protein FlgL
LQRVRELTVQATTGTNSDSDLSSIQDEIKSRLSEIDRVSGQTQFNGVNVLAKNGSMAIQVGANDGQTINIDLKIDSSTLGLVASLYLAVSETERFYYSNHWRCDTLLLLMNVHLLLVTATALEVKLLSSLTCTSSERCWYSDWSFVVQSVMITTLYL